MQRQHLPDNLDATQPGPLLSLLEPEKQVRVTEILNGFGLPPEKHEEYLAILIGHLEIALDGYFSRFK